MDAVKCFNAELSSLYEVKPPISKAKMTAITRGAIKAIKFYKHVVQSVEKFILKCKPEYKVPGLYVIDSIVRQSRHQFGTEKDVFAPRFAKNMRQTFINLFVCPGEDKSKIIRVLNLWQKNQVFAPDVIQPLFDLADPNNPIHKELGTPLQSNGSAAAAIKGSPALQKTPTKGSQQGIDGAHLGGTNLNLTDPNVLVQLQQLQRLLTRSADASSKSEVPVHFDRKLLDFDYGDDDDEAHSSPKAPANDSVSSLLTNPEVLRQLQTLQQTMTAGQSNEMDMDTLRKLQEMKQQEDEFDKHLAQTVPNLPFAAECEFKPGNSSSMLTGSYYLPPSVDMTQPPPGYKPPQPFEPPPQIVDNDVQFIDPVPSGVVEVITLDHGDSRSPTPDDRYNRRRRSRSRERSRDRRDRRSRRSRSRSKTRRHRTRSRDRNNKAKEKESEKDKERKKRGLPVIKKDNLSVCSTTLWVGHLSKLVHQEDLSNTFGEFGDIVSIDLIPPRGCAFIVMHRRQDAARCLTKLKNHNMHGKAITLAWAPGKGVKGKDLKDYWEGDLGVSYIPFHKLKPDIDLELLEDGGMVDEDTMPAWMKSKVSDSPNKQALSGGGLLMEPQINFMQPLADVGLNSRPPLDTSQPPPGAGLLQPPPMLPMVSPFQFDNRLLGVNLAAGMLPPNVPIGVPPPNMGGPLMQNPQLVGLSSPFQMQQMSMQANDANKHDGNMKSLSETLLGLTQPFGMVPQPPVGLPAPHDDNMDVEMEDAEKPERPLLLSEQLQASMGQFHQRINPGGLGSDENDVDGRRERRGGDRERRNSRSRERDRNRDRGYQDRGRDRKDDRRERPNRWGEREADPVVRREREKTLNDRLQQMAMPDVAYSNHDRPPRAELPIEPPEGPPPGPHPMDRMFPPMQHNGPPEIDEIYMHGGPPDTFDEMPMNGPPPIMDDYPPPIMDDYAPPPVMMDDFDPRMEEPPLLGRMHPRDDYEPDRFIRGRRDFRDGFDGGRGRGPPPMGPDFFPPRDGFGPPLRPMMRGDFPPRGPVMRGPGPHKFHPRAMPMRGPRPPMAWNDGPNFRPRFDHPDFHRGGVPPGMFDEPPRHRSGRFEDRRHGGGRPDFGHDNAAANNEGERFEKRSRWGGESPKPVEENRECTVINLVDDASDPPPSVPEVKGGNTPLHDEPLNVSEEKAAVPENHESPAEGVQVEAEVAE